MKHSFFHFLATLLLAFAAACPVWAESYVTVGTDNYISNDMPYGNYNFYSTTQSIYTSTEMGSAKVITSIAYQVYQAGTCIPDVDIYMGHRSSSSFSGASDYQDVSKMTLVYSGTTYLGGNTGWEQISFQTPFYYNGYDNLVVVVAHRVKRNQVLYYFTHKISSKTLRRSSDTISSYGTATTTGSYNTYDYRPNTRFGYGFDAEEGGIGYLYTSSTTAAVAGSTANVASVTIPSAINSHTVTSIKGGFNDHTNLKEVVIPNTVTSINDYAFYNCSNLKSLTIGESVKSIGTNAFNYKPTKTIWLPETPPTGYAQANGTRNYTPNNSYTSLTNVTVYPNLKMLFAADGVKYAIISTTARTVDAIDSDYRAKAINIGQTVNYKGIAMTVHQVRDYLAYDNDSVLTASIKSPDNIGQYAFYNCNGLQSVDVSNVDSIGTQAFYNCPALTEATLGNELKDLGTQAFQSCGNLKNVKIGNSLRTIGGQAFSGCGNLERFHVGNQLDSIDAKAFEGCVNMKKFVSETVTPPACGERALIDIEKWVCMLYVPQSGIDAYRRADQWKDFILINDNHSEANGEGADHYSIIDDNSYINSTAFSVKELSYNRTFSSSWEPLYLPFSMKYDDWAADYQVARINAFYQYDDDRDGHIDRSVLEAIVIKDGELNPNYPYLIRAKSAGAKAIVLNNTLVYPTEVNSIDCSTIDSRFTFTGTYLPMDGEQLTTLGAYIMADGRLVEAGSTSTLAPFRWYLQVEDRNANNSVATSNRREIRIAITEEPSLTGIEYASLGLDESGAENSIFSIDGRRVQQPTQRGIYIVNGKKQVVR